MPSLERALALGLMVWCVWASSARADGPARFAVGAAVGEWRVVSADTHPEFLRLSLRDGERTTQVEIVRREAEASRWSTGRHVLMPAPGANPPLDALIATMEALRAWEEAGGGLEARPRHVEAESETDAADTGPQPTMTTGRRALSIAFALVAFGWTWVVYRQRAAT